MHVGFELFLLALCFVVFVGFDFVFGLFGFVVSFRLVCGLSLLVFG